MAEIEVIRASWARETDYIKQGATCYVLRTGPETGPGKVRVLVQTTLNCWVVRDLRFNRVEDVGVEWINPDALGRIVWQGQPKWMRATDREVEFLRRKTGRGAIMAKLEARVA